MARCGLFVLLVIALSLSVVLSYCHNDCNGHGTCGDRDRCICYKKRNGEFAYTGTDCSLSTCPKGIAWIGPIQKANDLHPIIECSGQGDCNRQTGQCQCFNDRTGIACERSTCPNDCMGQGTCYTQKQLASDVGRVYATPWDANKNVACVCDVGFRGLDCSFGKF